MFEIYQLSYIKFPVSESTNDRGKKKKKSLLMIIYLIFNFQVYKYLNFKFQIDQISHII